MLRSETGKTSPSFMVAVLLVVALILGYFGWGYLFPNPFKASELVVRESRRELSTRVRDFDQEIRVLMDKQGLSDSQRLREVEKLAQETKTAIDEYIDEARDRLAEIDTPLKTHQNRDERLTEKADDAKTMIDDRVAEKRDQLAGG